MKGDFLLNRQVYENTGFLFLCRHSIENEWLNEGFGGRSRCRRGSPGLQRRKRTA
jgi:hypothetical protein